MVKFKFKLMKIFVFILVLILSIESWTKADDISGIVSKKYNICLDEIKSISVEFDQMFSKTKFEELYTFKHTDDPSGKSLVSDMFWEFDNGDKILLACYKWNTEFDKNYVDEMRVTISSKEFDQFLLNE